MSADIAIRPQTRVTLPLGVCRYVTPIAGGHLFMIEENGRNQPVTRAKLEKWFAEGKVLIHGTKPLNAYDETGGLAPGQVLDTVESARAWYCRQWDKDPCSRSDKKLRAFMQYYAKAAKDDGVTHQPSPGTLARALRSRGEMGHRPSNVMLTRTGKVARKPRVDPVVARLLKRCALWFWSERGRDKQEAHARLEMMIGLYNKHFGNKGGRTPIVAPSRETTRVWINAAKCKETVRAKYTKREAKECFQGSVPTLTATRVLETVVIDATVVDGWCVWREATEMPLGRPTLYTAVDVRSRMVVAWFLTFEPPSLYGVMGLLRKIVTPNAHGIWGKPRTIVLDNAWENVSVSLREACSSAGINVHYAPIGTPEYKAIVEREFGTINKLVFHKLLGGAVPLKPHAMSALGLDPEKTASVMIEDLDDMLLQALWEVQAKERHTGIGEVPLLVWNKHLGIHGREIVGDLPALLLNFGQVETVTLTRSGVVTRDGLRFSHVHRVTELLEELGNEEPMRKRRKGSAKATVKIVVDPEDISKVTVWNHRQRKPVILNNVHAAFAKECKSRWEYRMVKAFVDDECQAFSTEEDRLKRRWKLRQMIEAASPAIKKGALRRFRALMSKQDPKPKGNLVMTSEVEASVDGREPVEEVAAVMAAVTADGDGLPVKGIRRGGSAAVEKRKETLARKRAEKAEARQETRAEANGTVGDGADRSRDVPDLTPAPPKPSDAPAPARTETEATPPSSTSKYGNLPFVKDALTRGSTS